jgi:RNA polymerase sigma-70 factor (ECF subfamily)
MAAAGISRRECDEEILARIASGDGAAFTELHRRWAQRVHRFASSRLGDAAAADDVVQEVFLAVHRGLPSYEGRSRFGTWLLGIAYHQTCRTLKRRSRAAGAPLEDVEHRAASHADPDARLDAARALEACAALIAARSPAQREALLACVAAGGSAGDVARRLGRRPETVRAQLFRLRRALRERLPGVGETLG